MQEEVGFQLAKRFSIRGQNTDSIRKRSQKTTLGDDARMGNSVKMMIQLKLV
jgi:hypothetical protein